MAYQTAAEARRRADGLISLIVPPPDETVSEWTDNFRVTDQGKYYVSLAEYQRAPMDAVSEQLADVQAFPRRDDRYAWSKLSGVSGELAYSVAGRRRNRPMGKDDQG